MKVRFIFILFCMGGIASCRLLNMNNKTESDEESHLCPLNTVLVPANADYGVDRFCVSKYEMKALNINTNQFSTDGGAGAALSPLSDYKAVSSPSGRPFVNVTRSQAETECNEIGGSLITNSQWMAIARNIESNPGNWSGSAVGSGQIFRGHSDNSPGNTLSVSNTNDPYDQTLDNASEALGSGREQYRVLYLTNGNSIWDFSGNAYEWVSTNLVGSTFTPSLAGAPGGTVQFTNAGFFDSTHTVNRFTFAPAGNYDATNGVGVFNRGVNGGVLRGGYYGDSNTGIYFANIFFGSGTALWIFGFRCVFPVGSYQYN